MNIQRIASKFRLKPGMQEEYKRRHDEIWPEMLELMKEAGIRNYTIWNQGEDLFGYFEVEDYEKCIQILSASEVKKRWDEYMKDIIWFEKNTDVCPNGEMKLMFLFEQQQT